MTKRTNKRGGAGFNEMREGPHVISMGEQLSSRLINPPSEDFLVCLTNFQDPRHLKKAIIQFMVADSKHDMNFTLKDYDKIFAALMLLPNFPQTMINRQSIEQYINNASTPENLHTRLLKIINQYTGMRENDGVNVLKELDEDSQIHSYSPDLYRILNDKSTSVDFEKVNIHGNNWLFQKYVMRNSGGEFDPAQVLASIRDLHGPALNYEGSYTPEYRLLLSLDDATFLSKIKQNIDSLNDEAIARSSASIQEVYTLNVLLLHENLMDPGSSFNPREDVIAMSNIKIIMIRPDQAGNITINGINIEYKVSIADPWVYQPGHQTYANGFFSRARVTADLITKNGNNYSSNITITAPGQITRAAEQVPQDINYQYTATTGADPTSNCRKFLKTMLTSIATLCMDRTRKDTTTIFQKLMKDSLLMQSKRMGDTGLGLIFLRLKQQLGDTVFNQLGKPVCSTIDRLAALSYNMMGINYMFFMRGGDQLEYYTCIREANIQTSEQREQMYAEKFIELKGKIIQEYQDIGNIDDIYTLIDILPRKLQDIQTDIENLIESGSISFHERTELKNQLYKIYIKRKKKRFFSSILNKQKKINRALKTDGVILNSELLFEIYSLIYEVLNFNNESIESFINPEGSEENYSMFLEIKNAYYDPYIPRRRGRSESKLQPADKVNIPDFSTIKLLFNKLNINEQTYNYYLSDLAKNTKIEQYYNATIMKKDIDYQGPRYGGMLLYKVPHEVPYKVPHEVPYEVPEEPTILENELIRLINENNENNEKPSYMDLTKILNIITNILTRFIKEPNEEDIQYNNLCHIIYNIIKNALFELVKHYEMNEFRIKQYSIDKENSQYYEDENHEIKSIKDLLENFLKTQNFLYQGLFIHRAPSGQRKSRPLKSGPYRNRINGKHRRPTPYGSTGSNLSKGGKRKTKNKKNKEKTRKTKNKLRKTRKRKNRQDKNKKP